MMPGRYYSPHAGVNALTNITSGVFRQLSSLDTSDCATYTLPFAFAVEKMAVEANQTQPLKETY